MSRSSTPAPTEEAPSRVSTPDPDEQAQSALLRAFLSTAQHFFGGFLPLFAAITDPRQPALITYPLAALLFTGVLMFACRLGAAANRTSLPCQWPLGLQVPGAVSGRDQSTR